MATGTIKKIIGDKGFGFISVDNSKDGDAFFRIQELPEGVSLNEGDKVEFELVKGDRGPKATSVRPAGQAANPAPEATEPTDAEQLQPAA